jgi:hypothetical protein
MVARKDAELSRRLGHGGSLARADASFAERTLPASRPCETERPRASAYCGGRRPARGAPRRARLHGLPEPAVLRVRIDMGGMYEVEHSLLGVELVRSLVALCRAVRVIGSRAEGNPGGDER